MGLVQVVQPPRLTGQAATGCKTKLCLSRPLGHGGGGVCIQLAHSEPSTASAQWGVCNCCPKVKHVRAPLVACWALGEEG